MGKLELCSFYFYHFTLPSEIATYENTKVLLNTIVTILTHIIYIMKIDTPVPLYV